ncbi:MAG: hypothetical protein M3373_09290 [Gemmatimonadota bacterium]|nr:hypothetical protein [Gemmatimonadota bacterium]
MDACTGRAKPGKAGACRPPRADLAVQQRDFNRFGRVQREMIILDQ